MSRLKVRFLSPAPRRSKVRFAPTIFLFEKQKNVVARFLAPVAVPAFFGARSARLKNSTAATRSPPFSRHRRQSARSPRSVAPPLRRKDRSRRLGAFALRAALSFSFLRCSLRSQKVKDKGILSNGAPRAPTSISHSSFLILHCPFPAPPGSLFFAQRNLLF